MPTRHREHAVQCYASQVELAVYSVDGIGMIMVDIIHMWCKLVGRHSIVVFMEEGKGRHPRRRETTVYCRFQSHAQYS